VCHGDGNREQVAKRVEWQLVPHFNQVFGEHTLTGSDHLSRHKHKQTLDKIRNYEYQMILTYIDEKIFPVFDLYLFIIDDEMGIETEKGSKKNIELVQPIYSNKKITQKNAY